MAIDGLRAIKYTRGSLEVLDQTKLPHEFVYDKISTCEEAFDCIKAMRVRGMCYMSHYPQTITHLSKELLQLLLWQYVS